MYRETSQDLIFTEGDMRFKYCLNLFTERPFAVSEDRD